MVAKKVGYVSAVISATHGQSDKQATSFEGRPQSWGQLLHHVSRLAGGLRSIGITDGERVAILSANSDHYMALYLAVPWAGGVLTPLNARWSITENAYALDESQPAVVFASPSHATTIERIYSERENVPTLVILGPDKRDGWLNLTELSAHLPMENSQRGGDDLFAIFYTGGTTGKPKGVMLSHSGFVGNAMAMRELGLCPDGCRMLVVAPLFHLAGAAALLMAMLAGGTAVIAPSFDPTLILDLIWQDRVTDALLVPTMIQMLLAAPQFDSEKLITLRRLLYGASPMPESTLDRITAAAPHIDFFQAYGMTEVSCTATILGPDFHKGAHRAAGRHRGAGRAIATSVVIVADDSGRPLPLGQVGEILVRGSGLMLGYWKQPELTAETLRDGWMHTGDGGWLDEFGVLYVVDRLKDMIVSGGENVYSAEVENAILSHPSVAQCAVIGIPNEPWGESVHAVIVLLDGHHSTDRTIIDHCRGLIADYKCPRSVEFVSGLPVSAAGKVLKGELRASHWAGQLRNVS
jgi:long-chain acyl-CoA synthetase